MKKMRFYEKSFCVIDALCKIAHQESIGLLPFGGTTLAICNRRVPKDVDMLIITDSARVVDRFLAAAQRALPGMEYASPLRDYEDPHYPLKYPGRLDRFKLWGVQVDITSQIKPITGNKQLILDVAALHSRRVRRWAPFGYPAVPLHQSLVYCLFRAALGGNEDKRQEVRLALQGLNGGLNVDARVPGVSVVEKGARQLRYEVGFRGSKLELLI